MITPGTTQGHPIPRAQVGHEGQLAPRCRVLDAMIKKFYYGIQKAVHPFSSGSKIFNTSSLGLGEPQFKTPAVGGAC